MRIEIDYIAQLLEVFLDADTAHISVPDLPGLGIRIESETDQKSLDERFLFHLQLAIENQLISNKDMCVDGLESVGIRMGAGCGVVLTGVPIRLTQRGHDFASALHNKEVLMKLKSELKDAPFKVMFDGSQKLLTHFLKKKLDGLLDGNA